MSTRAPRRPVRSAAARDHMDAANVTAEETPVAAVNVTAGETRSQSVPLTGRSRDAARRRPRRSPMRWVSNGGLTTLLLALPMLLVFTAFSWYPMVRLVLMSLQETNLFAPATWVGLDNFRAVLDDPLFPVAVKNTAYFALLALIFGYPIPLLAAVLMSETRRF